MSRHKSLKKEVKKFRAFEVIDWLQENRLDKIMCRWCGDFPPNYNSEYCSDACEKSGAAIRIGNY